MRGTGRLVFFRLLPLMSALGAAVIVVTTVGAGAIAGAVERADPVLVLLAFGLGSLIEAVKAQRSALMLRQDHPITWTQSFATMVVSKAAGRVVPCGPTTLALRCLLTRRVAGTAIPFATGVFLISDVLDRLALLPLLVYILALHGAHVGLVLLVAAPAVAACAWHGVARHRAACPPLARRSFPYTQAVCGVVRGGGTVAARGWSSALPVTGLTLLAMGLAILRVDVLLHAFLLDPTTDKLFLFILLSGLVASLPISIPGVGMWTTLHVLSLVGIVGTGTGGYVLVSSGIAASETPLLAAGVLLWWSCTRAASPVRLGDLRSLARSS